jgi:hypothetical protein
LTTKSQRIVGELEKDFDGEGGIEENYDIFKLGKACERCEITVLSSEFYESRSFVSEKRIMIERCENERKYIWGQGEY